MSPLSDNAMERLREAAAIPDLEGTKYRMVRFLAAGGMGEIHLVEDTELDRRVAMKVLSGIDGSDEMARRMLREAQIVASLEHPGIVPVHDVGRLADGRVFFTMKYVEGERFDQYLGHEASLRERLRIFHRLCEAVAFAHARGVLHRDMKPENVMVGPFGEVLVMDWGIAKLMHEPAAAVSHTAPGTPPRSASADRRRTAAGDVLGTPSYMSPEQARGDVGLLDERTDVYALGAMLFHLLTDAPPASGATVAGAPASGAMPSGARTSRTSTPGPPNSRTLATASRLNADLAAGIARFQPLAPRALAAICQRAMAAEREERYASVGALAGDVLAWLDARPVTVYRENLFEKSGRFLRNNQFIVLLILAYLLMRLIVFFSVGF